MQRYSRWIAAAALAGLILPFVVNGLSTLTSIEPMYLAIVLAGAVAAFLGWRIFLARSAEDED